MAPTKPGIIDISNVSEDALAIVKMLEGILDRIIVIYQSYSVPIPDRRYWTMNVPATDEEQLVVSFMQGYLGKPGDQANEPVVCNNGTPRSAVVNISVARPQATPSAGGRAPAPEAIQQSSEISAVDAWVLLQATNNLDVWDDLGGRGLGVIATLESAETQGGYQVVTLQLTLAVP